MNPHPEFPVGTRVVIGAASNRYARVHVGKAGTVVGEAPLGMLIVNLDDGTRDYYARPFNLRHESKGV